MAAMLKTVGSDLKHFTAKTREKGGRRGLGPWPLRCLSQTLFYREERMLRLAFRFCVPLTVGVAMYL